MGNVGCGKTVITMIMAQLLAQNKKILMIEDTNQNKSIKKIFNIKIN